MENIFEYISQKELENIVGEPVNTQVVSANTNSYICVINGKHIVKAPTNRRSAVSLRREINISNVLHERSLLVQTPVWRYVELNPVQEKSQLKGVSFCAVAPMIDGEHPDTIDSSKLMADLGCFLATLHKIPAISFGGVSTYMDMDFKYMVDTWERQKRHKGINKERWLRFKRYLKETVLRRANEVYIQNIRPVLTHADLHVGNILVNKSGHLSGVLDFGNASLTPEPQDVLIASRGYTNGGALLNAYQGQMGQRVDAREKLQKTWQLARKMNVKAEQLLDRFLAKENQRG